MGGIPHRVALCLSRRPDSPRSDRLRATVRVTGPSAALSSALQALRGGRLPVPTDRIGPLRRGALACWSGGSMIVCAHRGWSVRITPDRRIGARSRRRVARRTFCAGADSRSVRHATPCDSHSSTQDRSSTTKSPGLRSMCSPDEATPSLHGDDGPSARYILD